MVPVGGTSVSPDVPWLGGQKAQLLSDVLPVPERGGAAVACLGGTQKILGWAMGKVKQTIYFQSQWSDVSVSV